MHPSKPPILGTFKNLFFPKNFVAYSMPFATVRNPQKGCVELVAEQNTIFKMATKNKKDEKKPAPRPKNVASATAASILGIPAGKAKTPGTNGKAKVKSEWVKYYNNLLELRDRLSNQMDGLAKESAEEMANYSLHMADAGTDNFDRDFALSLLSSDQDAIYEIEEALKRIEKNTYGICELTGKAIPRTRLDAIPWTRFTVEAQSQLEREGALKSRRLGTLGTVDTTGAAEGDGDEGEEAEEKPMKEKE
jgi:RNA polymerase-binding transcription factor DksA